MKIIFLDIDGVLNSQKYFIENHEKIIAFNKKYQDTLEFKKECKMLEIDLAKLAILQEIIQVTNSFVVIISSWRKLSIYPLVKDELIKYGIPIIGETTSDGDNRGLGIKRYLMAHQVDEYIIIDDDIFSDYDDELMKKLVKTDFYENRLDKKSKINAIKKLVK